MALIRLLYTKDLWFIADLKRLGWNKSFDYLISNASFILLRKIWFLIDGDLGRYEGKFESSILKSYLWNANPRSSLHTEHTESRLNIWLFFAAHSSRQTKPKHLPRLSGWNDTIVP